MNLLFLVVRDGKRLLLSDSAPLLSLPSVPREHASPPEKTLERLLSSFAIVRARGEIKKIGDIPSADVYEVRGADLFAPTRPGFSWCDFKESASFDPIVRSVRSLERAAPSEPACAA